MSKMRGNAKDNDPKSAKSWTTMKGRIVGSDCPSTHSTCQCSNDDSRLFLAGKSCRKREEEEIPIMARSLT
jgi:hypothetical protein